MIIIMIIILSILMIILMIIIVIYNNIHTTTMHREGRLGHARPGADGDQAPPGPSTFGSISYLRIYL